MDFDKLPKHFLVWRWGGGALPSNRLIVMCRWMGWHFYNSVDYKGVVLSIELLEWGAHCQDFGGKNVPVIRDFKP